ncbi:MAG: sulfite exporter TauE/SafE family protein [Dehalococcoidia bacterium]
MTAAVIAAAIGITFLSAGTQSLTGFGFALVMVPLLSLVWDVKLAVITSTLLSSISLVPLVVEVRRWLRLSKILPLATGSLVGVPVGLLIFTRIDADALKVCVASLVIVASLLLYFAPRFSLGPPTVPGSVAAGMLSGMLRASTSMGGPPLVLYMLSRENEVEAFRSTVLAVFLFNSVLTVTGLVIADEIGGEVLTAIGVALPALAAGVLAGAWLRPRVDEELFRRIALAVLVSTSVGVIVSALAV